MAAATLAAAAALLGTAGAHADGVAGRPYGQSVVSDNPLVFYPLDVRSATAVDESGNGHNVQVVGSGGEESGLTFGDAGPLATQQNGVNLTWIAHGVTLAEGPTASFLPAGNAPRTLEGWFRSSPETQAGARYPIVAWGGPGTGRAYGLVVMQRAVVLDYYDGTTTFNGAPNLFDGRWHQIVATYDGDTAYAYVDGHTVGAPAPIRPQGFINTQSPSRLIIGDWIDHAINSSLQGSVAEVAVYPVVLNGARIQAHFLAAGGQISATASGVSTIASSLPSPADAFGNPGIVLASAAVAVGGTLFITFPAQLFNLTLQENYATITGWFAPLRRRLGALRRAPADPGAPTLREQVRKEWRPFAAVIAAGALLGGFLDPSFGFNTTSVESYAGIVLSMLAGIAVAASVSDVYHRRRHGAVPHHLRALPLGLVLGALCVVVSRVTGFQPGYLYGVVVGVAFDRVLTPRESGHVAALSTLSVICASVLAWVLWVPLNAHAAAQGAFPLLVVLDDFLAAMLVGGLVGSVIGLLPLRFLPGGTVREWSPRIWFALFGVAVFALVEFVIRSPAASGGHHSGLVLTLVLFVAFAAVSVGFREYFAARWRREHGVTAQGLGALLRELITPRAGEPAAVPAGAVTGVAVPAPSDVAVSGGGAGSAVVSDEVAPADDPVSTPR